MRSLLALAYPCPLGQSVNWSRGLARLSDIFDCHLDGLSLSLSLSSLLGRAIHTVRGIWGCSAGIHDQAPESDRGDDTPSNSEGCLVSPRRDAIPMAAGRAINATRHYRQARQTSVSAQTHARGGGVGRGGRGGGRLTPPKTAQRFVAADGAGRAHVIDELSSITR
jgi:hypothetical protein